MKQSSIEQLFDEIFKIPFNTPESEDLYCEIMDLKEKYKQMHKQEVIDFAQKWEDSMLHEYDSKEDMYDKTFNT